MCYVCLFVFCFLLFKCVIGMGEFWIYASGIFFFKFEEKILTIFLALVLFCL